MRLSRLFAVPTVMLVVGAPVASAQLSSATSLGAVIEHAPVAWSSGTGLSQTLRIDNRWAQAAVDGSLMGTRDGLRLDEGSADLGLAPPSFGALRWSANAHVAGGRTLASSTQVIGRVESALSVAALGGGAWLGAGAERGLDVDVGRTSPMMLFGLWRPIGRTLFTVSSASHSIPIAGRPRTLRIVHGDSVWNEATKRFVPGISRVEGDSGAPSRTLAWSDLEARLAWSAPRVALEARVGARAAYNGIRGATWGRVTASVAVAQRVSLVASAGNEAAIVAFGPSRSRFASLGIRVSPAALLRRPPPIQVRPSANAFLLRKLEGETYRVSIRATDARTVELSGDFASWRPIALEQTEPDLWETTLVLPPGTYHLNLRVNGDRWKAPPGLPATDDEFNGSVGLLVVNGGEQREPPVQ